MSTKSVSVPRQAGFDSRDEWNISKMISGFGKIVIFPVDEVLDVPEQVCIVSDTVDQEVLFVSPETFHPRMNNMEDLISVLKDGQLVAFTARPVSGSVSPHYQTDAWATMDAIVAGFGTLKILSDFFGVIKSEKVGEVFFPIRSEGRASNLSIPSPKMSDYFNDGDTIEFKAIPSLPTNGYCWRAVEARKKEKYETIVERDNNEKSNGTATGRLISISPSSTSNVTGRWSAAFDDKRNRQSDRDLLTGFGRGRGRGIRPSGNSTDYRSLGPGIRFGTSQTKPEKNNFSSRSSEMEQYKGRSGEIKNLAEKSRETDQYKGRYGEMKNFSSRCSETEQYKGRSIEMKNFSSRSSETEQYKGRSGEMTNLSGNSRGTRSLAGISRESGAFTENEQLSEKKIGTLGLGEAWYKPDKEQSGSSLGGASWKTLNESTTGFVVNLNHERAYVWSVQCGLVNVDPGKLKSGAEFFAELQEGSWVRLKVLAENTGRPIHQMKYPQAVEMEICRDMEKVFNYHPDDGECQVEAVGEIVIMEEDWVTFWVENAGFVRMKLKDSVKTPNNERPAFGFGVRFHVRVAFDIGKHCPEKEAEKVELWTKWVLRRFKFTKDIYSPRYQLPSLRNRLATVRNVRGNSAVVMLHDIQESGVLSGQQFQEAKEKGILTPRNIIYVVAVPIPMWKPLSFQYRCLRAEQANSCEWENGPQFTRELQGNSVQGTINAENAMFRPISPKKQSTSRDGRSTGHYEVSEGTRSESHKETPLNHESDCASERNETKATDQSILDMDIEQTKACFADYDRSRSVSRVPSSKRSRSLSRPNSVASRIKDGGRGSFGFGSGERSEQTEKAGGLQSGEPKPNENLLRAEPEYGHGVNELTQIEIKRKKNEQELETELASDQLGFSVSQSSRSGRGESERRIDGFQSGKSERSETTRAKVNSERPFSAPEQESEGVNRDLMSGNRGNLSTPSKRIFHYEYQFLTEDDNSMDLSKTERDPKTSENSQPLVKESSNPVGSDQPRKQLKLESTDESKLSGSQSTRDHKPEHSGVDAREMREGRGPKDSEHGAEKYRAETLGGHGAEGRKCVAETPRSHGAERYRTETLGGHGAEGRESRVETSKWHGPDFSGAGDSEKVMVGDLVRDFVKELTDALTGEDELFTMFSEKRPDLLNKMLVLRHKNVI